MSTRAKLAAALASVGVLGGAWNVATANGHTIAPASATTGTTDTSTAGTPTAGATAPARTGGTSTAGRSSSQAATGAAGTSGAASTGTLKDGTYTGAASTHRFGSVTVTVTVSGGRITSLSEKVVSDGDRKSQMINARSVPTLRSAILAANGSGVSTVSGATYTTRAYLTSLQSALDKARQ